jgi:hypothetical protein
MSNNKKYRDEYWKRYRIKVEWMDDDNSLPKELIFFSPEYPPIYNSLFKKCVVESEEEYNTKIRYCKVR